MLAMHDMFTNDLSLNAKSHHTHNTLCIHTMYTCVHVVVVVCTLPSQAKADGGEKISANGHDQM